MELSARVVNSMGRIWRTKIMKFGVYEKVLPVESTPSRTVPDHIDKPDYVSPQPHTSTISTSPLVYKTPEIKDVIQLRGMRRSCKLAASILAKVQDFVEPGKTTDDIDELVHKLTIEAGAYPSPLHYKGFPKSVCTSVNNVVAHGIPDLRPLVNGDLVNVDITVYFKGFHGDCSRTFPVGTVDDRGLHLIGVTEECLDLAVRACGPGVPLRAIGSAVQRHARRSGLTVVPAVLGHGIGSYFHGPPDIYHIANRYPGPMRTGMTFTIEPALTHGGEHTVVLEDEWTLVTADGARSAQAEHTVLITEDGVDVLTA